MPKESMLLTLEEIAAGLEEIQAKQPVFYDLEDGEIPDMRWRPSSLDDALLAQLEANLNVVLPPVFKSLILRFDFAGLCCAHFWFDSPITNYADSLEKFSNEEDCYLQWWGGGEKPPYLFIGSSDGYVLLLDPKTDEILSFDHEYSWTTALRIATNLEFLLRIGGTLQVMGSQAHIVKQLSEEGGSDPRSLFWQHC